MPSLGRNQHFLNANELMNRWGISEWDLLNILSSGELHFRDAAEDLNTYCYDNNMLKPDSIPIMIFELTDVKRYERNHPEYKPKEDPGILNSKKRRELGRLRQEKTKWDLSLKAAVHIGIFCSEKEEGTIT